MERTDLPYREFKIMTIKMVTNDRAMHEQTENISKEKI